MQTLTQQEKMDTLSIGIFNVVFSYLLHRSYTSPTITG
jgi:hypothetical protein